MAKTVYSPTEKKILNQMFVNSGFVFITFTMTKMEANAFSMTMQPALDELYKDKPEEKKVALRRHNQFFNTHAVMFSFIAGLTYALEKEKIERGSVDDETIDNIKVALMGPTAGMGDAFFFNCVRVIAAGIAIGLCSTGNILGTLLFILLYGGSQIIARYYLLRAGYSLGTSFIDTIFESGLMDALTKAASVLGMVMVGAMVSSQVNVKLAWTIDIGGAQVVLLDVINSIMPGILSILLVFGLMKLIKKGWTPTKLVLLILFGAIALAFCGVF
ncbi:MAG: PTS system mannose/fructose/sorbose family transporter subunit IID [Erysipelotrichia bacterium]|nr:PTS system mannose/fructose/sorbose family transporter subunit IID [Erysipelotrichia bacterium]